MEKIFDYIKRELKKPLLVVAFGVILFALLDNLGLFWGYASKLLGLLSPVFYGFAIAFILNLPMRAIERWLFKNPKEKAYRFKRPISLILTLLLVMLILIALVSIVLPQLASSISGLIEKFPGYVASVQDFASGLLVRLPFDESIWGYFESISESLLSALEAIAKGVIPNVLGATKGITSGVYNLFMGVIVSIYMLYNKEKLSSQLQKVLKACMKKERFLKLMEVARFTNDTFSRFFSGQLIEAVILGVLCFIGMSILRMPYALLISVIIGVTGLIPIFGAFIGTIPSAFILFMIHPLTALWFVIFIIVLQQIEGNIIYPKVVGNSIGLSGLWVLIAITVGGGLFGLLGILLGIPLMAVLYHLFGELVNKRVEKKEEKEKIKEKAEARNG